MKDQLKDIIKYTHDLGCFSMAKITAEPEETSVFAIADDKSVVMNSTFHNTVDGMDGTIGIPSLSKLKVLLNIQEYAEDAVLKINKQNDNPSSLTLKNKSGDFENEYRFMSKEVIEQNLKTLKFKGANWKLEFKPSTDSIRRFKYQSQANSEENSFFVSMNGKDLVFNFGSGSAHTGKFVFEHNAKGTLGTNTAWPVKQVLNILDLPGDKIMKISEVACEISVNSGLAIYTYILPALSKQI
jgi:hypothetical protein